MWNGIRAEVAGFSFDALLLAFIERILHFPLWRLGLAGAAALLSLDLLLLLHLGVHLLEPLPLAALR